MVRKATKKSTAGSDSKHVIGQHGSRGECNKSLPQTAATRTAKLVSPGEEACDLISVFATVEDPRLDRQRQHALLDILFIAVAATLAGAEGPSDIADFAKHKLAWCRRFVPLANGVPSHDTIGRVLSLINPQAFQKAFLEWLRGVQQELPSGEVEHIAIDGKTARGSHHSSQRSHPLHLVSAWGSRLGLTLGQVAVADHSNEITAIPALLQMLELKGAIVSIDALGCQKEIASKIVAKEGDYVLAVKKNQPELYAALLNFFLLREEQKDGEAFGCRQHRTCERSRGREEDRRYIVAPLPAHLQKLTKAWPGLRSIGQVTTFITTAAGVSTEVRFYISSRPPKVSAFATAVRKHWSIESMHWILDVVFGEDASRLREGHLVQNFGFLRKFVLSMLKQDTSSGSLKCKRKRAGWNTNFLEEVLFLQQV